MAWNLSDPTQQFIELEPSNFVLGKYKAERGTSAEASHTSLNILPKLKQFKEENKYCDVEIKVGEKIFQAHKVVLAAWSPCFLNLLDPQMRDVTERLLVEHTDADVFAEFVEFLYTGDAAPKDSNVLELLGIARDLQVNLLTALCEEFLSSTLTVNNFVSRLLTSHKYDLKGLSEKVINFGRQHLQTVVKQREFLNMPPVKFYQLLNFLKLGQSDLEVKLGLISHWVGYNIEERERLVLHLLSRIEWTMPPSDIIGFITSSDNLFTANELCLFQLMHRLYMSFQQLGPYINTYQGLHHIYQDIIDQDFPKVLSESEKLDDTVHFKVTVKAQSSHIKMLEAPFELTKDASMNTDIDNTYFDEVALLGTATNSDGMPTNVKEELASADDNDTAVDVTEQCGAVEFDKDNSLKINDEVTKENHDEELKEVEPVIEIEKKPSRRKGRPRKHAKAGDGSIIVTNDVKKIKTENVKKIKAEKKSRKTVNGRNEKGKIKIKIKTVPAPKTVPATDAESNTNSSNTRVVKVERDEIETNIDNSDTDHYLSDIEQPSNDKTKEKDIVVDSKSKIPKKKLQFKGSKSSMYKSKQVTEKVRKAKKPDTRPSRMKDRPFLRCSEENCDYQTKNEKYLARHVNLVHNMNVKLSCKHCDFSSSVMRDLCIHSKQHYPNGPPYHCDEKDCDFQGQRMGLLLRHLMEHNNERPYTCDVCNKTFRTENQLSNHKKLHEGRQFVCDVCNKRFTTKGGMQTHRAIHFDNKPYLCDWCGFSTKHQSHLISHRKLHTGDLLKCSMENCSFITNKRGYMTHHMNAHLNIRNHICQVCGKAFVVRSKLIRHEKIHLEEKLFKCKSCDYETSRTDRMKLHIQSHGGAQRRKAGMRFPKVHPLDDDFDYHQMYEKIEPSSSSFYGKSITDHVSSENNVSSGVIDIQTVSASDLGSETVVTSLPSDPIQMPFSQSTYRQLDMLSVAAAGLEFAKLQSAGFQHTFEQQQGPTFEHI